MANDRSAPARRRAVKDFFDARRKVNRYAPDLLAAAKRRALRERKRRERYGRIVKDE